MRFSVLRIPAYVLPASQLQVSRDDRRQEPVGLNRGQSLPEGGLVMSGRAGIFSRVVWSSLFELGRAHEQPSDQEMVVRVARSWMNNR